MSRRPPRSPLFPSPTLSRSLSRRARASAQQRRPRQPASRDMTPAGGALAAHVPRGSHVARRRLSRPALLRDRKSTRLNSSHSQISYAVFCLKKKKNISALLAIIFISFFLLKFFLQLSSLMLFSTAMFYCSMCINTFRYFVCHLPLWFIR